MLRVGLTGGIASGKSRVLRRLEAAGFHTIDLDQVAHEMMAPGGPAYADVVSAFGASILAADSTIDRRRLGELVFADAEARARLNRIVHPRVRAAEASRIAEIEGVERAVFVTDAALLVESGVHLRFDRLVVVHCPADEQRRRLMARDRLDQAAAQARIDAQMPLDEKPRYGHLTVDSSGTPEDTDRQADEVAKTLRGLASEPRPRISVASRRLAAVLAESPPAGPRGLTARRIAERIAQDGGMEMEGLASLLDPPAKGPWYRAAQEWRCDEGVDGLLAPVVAWCLGRAGLDEPFLCGAAASLSRLVALDEQAARRACRAAWDLAVRLTAPAS